MEVSIPYQSGLLLGRAVDIRKLNMGFMLSGCETAPTAPMVNLTTLNFSMVHDLKDLCDVIGIPPEYALKVKAHLINDDVVTACMHRLGRKDTTMVIFRGTFLHKKEYLPFNTLPLKAKSALSEGETKELSQAGEQDVNSLLTDALNNSDSLKQENLNSVSSAEGKMGMENEAAQYKPKEQSLSDPHSSGKETLCAPNQEAHRDTHWVKAQEIGNEIIIILRVSSMNEEKLRNMQEKLREGLGSYRGLLSSETMKALKKVAGKVDAKLSKSYHSDIKMDIEYCVHQDLQVYPATMEGMVAVLETFADNCVGWTDASRQGCTYPLQASLMSWHLGDCKEKKSFYKEIFANTTVKGNQQSQPTAVYHPRNENQDSDTEGDSFVELEMASHFYPLRVTLQSFEGDVSDADKCTSLTSLAQSQYPEATANLHNQLYDVLNSSKMAINKLQAFLTSKRFNQEASFAAGQKVLRSVNIIALSVCDTIRQLDMITMPESSELEEILAAQPVNIVNNFIESVTSKLPPGDDLDLLILGKTGHGKSATGNSILMKRNYFKTSHMTESETSSSKLGWAEIDGRVIKVVDTPGVCDTAFSEDKSSIDLAFHSISTAISYCNGKFDALLLVMSFPIRTTFEERKAIELLKRVLGEDVIKSHGICVISFGDTFEAQMEVAQTKQTFEEWCQDQKGFMKDLLKECNYRCVLFNNLATDPKKKKRQLIKLITYVDSLKMNGKPYTSELFEFAQKELKRIQQEEGVPEESEEVMKELAVVLDFLNIMVENTGEAEGYAKELSELRTKVDTLKNRVSKVEEGQMNHLVDTVFSLAGAIHVKLEVIANRSQPDSPDEPSASPVDALVLTNTEQAGGTDPENTEYASFEDHRNKLQECMDKEVAPQVERVNKEVTKNVEQKIRSETNCFPGCAMVVMEDGQRVAMRNVHVGQKVMIRDNKGVLRFDTVYMFGHNDPDATADFVVVKTRRGKVRVSREHLVFCVRHGKEQCVSAEKIEIGDELLTMTSDGATTLEASPVIGKVVESFSGVFAPFTMEGTIVVDESLMSCYIDCGLAHATAHSFLWPMRQLHKLSPPVLALVNNLGTKKETKGAIPWLPKTFLWALNNLGFMGY